jgi:endonuclease/exonuclease/phosphatase family metal-dependent hydrolase
VPDSAVGPRRSGGMRVVSWNVHACVGTDGRRSPERVAAVLAEIDADAVALQEIDERGARPGGGQLKTLAQATGLRATSCRTLWGSCGGYGIALLTRHELRAARALDLSLPGSEPRRALDVDLDLSHTGVRLIVTHLGLRTRERRIQVLKLIRALDDHADRPLLVLGDINEWRRWAAPLRLLRRRFGALPTVPSWPSWRPFMALDRIYVEPRAALVGLWAHATPLARVSSDHLPVVAQLALLPLREVA